MGCHAQTPSWPPAECVLEWIIFAEERGSVSIAPAVFRVTVEALVCSADSEVSGAWCVRTYPDRHLHIRAVRLGDFHDHFASGWIDSGELQ